MCVFTFRNRTTFNRLYRPTGSLECSTEDTLTSVSYHGAFITSHLIDWYTDVADQNIHYGPPHAFHTG